jgi:hypothetical protein
MNVVHGDRSAHGLARRDRGQVAGRHARRRRLAPVADHGAVTSRAACSLLRAAASSLFVWGRWCAHKDGKDEPLWDSRST